MSDKPQAPSADATTSTAPNAAPVTTTNEDAEQDVTVDALLPAGDDKNPNQGFRFWTIVAALAFTALLSSLEGTFNSALPKITDDLGGGNSFIWVPNGYLLATIVMLPLMAQANDFFGRRWLTLISVATFTLGSGICGGWCSLSMEFVQSHRPPGPRILAYEWTLAKTSLLPKDIILNRTAATVLAVTFLHTVASYWSSYFMPIYFQSVKDETSFWFGVDTLPLFAGILPFVILGGILLAKFGKYKPMHLTGMAIIISSFGIFSVLDEQSPKAAWAYSQLLFAVGAGLMTAILLPTVQAPFPETFVALSTGVWAFVRGFGTVREVTIPFVIFNNECRIRAAGLADQTVASYLNTGKAYQYATKDFLDSIQDASTRQEVVDVFTSSLRTIWYVGVAFAGFGWLLILLEKEVTLRSKLNTKFGLEEKKKAAGKDVDVESGADDQSEGEPTKKDGVNG